MFSPAHDAETFSTPPTTPTNAILDTNVLDRPSLSRRNSRPSNLRISQTPADWKSDIVLVNQTSPDPSTKVLTPSTAVPHTNGMHANGHTNGAHGSINGILHHHPAAVSSPLASGPAMPQNPAGKSPRPPPVQRQASPMRSPCFVHSKLQGPSLTGWLREKHIKAEDEPTIDGPHGVNVKPIGISYPDGTFSDGEDVPRLHPWCDEDEETAGSVTKQLAETAVGVREMSKQLGRTLVRSSIQSILIVTKARDNRLIKLTRELALYLMLKPHKTGRGMIVYVDAQLKTSRRFDAAGIEKDHPELFVPVPRRRSSSSSSLASMTSSLDSSAEEPEGQLRYWTADMCSRSPHLFDFVVTLGGDGTVLFTSWLFQRVVPPVLPFALGSLGFLTNFDFADHRAVMDNAIDSGIRVNLRMRFTCTVYRAVATGKRRRAVKKGDTGEILMRNLEKGGWEALESGFAHDGKIHKKDKEIMCYTTRPVESFEVLNDLVVDRGPSPYVSLLELFGDEHHLTTVQADGLTISTPTGSTAYSLSAGGSLVHPEIPAILITPICPHTLSFRPMLLPDSMELRVCVPFNSRSTAWASFDGRGRVELKQGDHIKITASKYPFPTVCAQSQSVDWFHSISRTLKWNERERQKSFVVVEEEPIKRRRRRRSSSASTASAGDVSGKGDVSDEEDDTDDDEDDEEEEEKFDIDDLSSSESPKSATSKASTDYSGDQGIIEPSVSREKALEIADGSHQRQAEAAARALAEGSPWLKLHNKGSPRSGVETPDRFAGPHPHPPKLSPRHVQFISPDLSMNSSTTSLAHPPAMERDVTLMTRNGNREREVHSPRPARLMHTDKEKERTGEGREVDRETLKTPTLAEGAKRRRSRDRSAHRAPAISYDPNEPHSRRAFAVWGQDESDSATSDSESI